MKTREERRLAEEKRNNQYRNLCKFRGYKGIKYSNKETHDRLELDPDKCYFVREGIKGTRTKTFKKVATKTLRNRIKRELHHNPEEVGTYNGGTSKKTFEYKWNIN